MSSKHEKQLDQEQLFPAHLGAYDAAARSSRNRGLKIIGAWLLIGATVILGAHSMLGAGCSGMQHLWADGPAAMSAHAKETAACPQVDALQPVKYRDIWTKLSKDIGTSEGFRKQAIDWLAGAVRVKTESFDHMGPVGEDARWKAFEPFHEYLLGAFPLVHTTLRLTKVNTYGLLYEWEGSNKSLKPIMLAAHQDVVPVDATTVDQWTHPPYSGHYDGKYIWGRGSSDDKSGLISVLASVETLLKNEFKPTRTVVLAFGFDEETSGFQGAGNLASAAEKIYGKDGIAMVVDEGSGFSQEFGSWVATPGIAEKGYMNVKVTVQTAGGHSSVPPPHTSIGILAALLVHAEQNPIQAELTRDQPIYWTMQCIGAHAKDVPSDLREAIQRSASSDKALSKLSTLLFENHLIESLVGTTQAIDLIQGGVKSNALPEQVWAVINHRITVTSSVAALEERDTALLKDLAKKFNLTFGAFGEEVISEEEVASAKGSLTLNDYANTALEPAPVTPTTGDEAEAYRVLSGTIKAAFAAFSRNIEGEGRDDDIIVAPSMMSGNTDTRFYWSLSQNIFRYNHHNGGKNQNALSDGIHTVNEHIEVDAYLEMIQFFTTLILNADEVNSI